MKTMMKKINVSVVAGLMGLVINVSARADVLVNWSYYNNSEFRASVSSSYTGTLSATNLLNHWPASAGFSNYISAAPNAYVQTQGMSVPLGTAVADFDQYFDSSKYFAFSVTPSSALAGNGETLQLSNLSINYGITYSGNAPSYKLYLYSSTDDFATSKMLGSLPLPSGSLAGVDGTTGVGTKPYWDIDLSSLQSNNQKVEFRLYALANTSVAADTLRIFNITLSGGVVAIPEPSIFVLLLAGGGLLLALRRSKNSR